MGFLRDVANIRRSFVSSFADYTSVLDMHASRDYGRSLFDSEINRLNRSHIKLNNSFGNYDMHFKKRFRAIILDLLDIKYEIADVSYLFLLVKISNIAS